MLDLVILLMEDVCLDQLIKVQVDPTDLLVLIHEWYVQYGYMVDVKL